MPSRSHPCPNCGAASIPIVYGLPAFELFEQAERGELELGGCMVADDNPRRACPSCGKRF